VGKALRVKHQVTRDPCDWTLAVTKPPTVWAGGWHLCMFFFVCLSVIGMPAKTYLYFLPDSTARGVQVGNVLTCQFDSPTCDVVHAPFRFSVPLMGAAQELMEFLECGPLDLSSLLRFQVFSPKFLQSTLLVVG
jgi:hypothetical protein